MIKQKFGKRLISYLIVVAIMFGGLFFGSGFTIAQQTTSTTNLIEVDTYEELVDALATADENTEIVVTQEMILPDGADLNGHGATVRVEKPFIDEDGIIRSGDKSNYCVFVLDDDGGVKNVTIKNMTIIGGFQEYGLGAIYNDGCNLTMENVTVMRSYRGLYCYGGSEYIGYKDCNIVLKNCNIVRNVADYGAGILCTNGTLIMDGCSLSENYTTNMGGGAMELNGDNAKFYANNTVIINNSSTEIGGAINCYLGATMWLANCIIAGNVTTADDAYYGGGVGLHSNGGFYAVNTIIEDNYQIVGDTITRSDIGLYKNTPNKFVNCLYGEIIKYDYYCPNALNTYITLTNCKQDTTSTFAAKYRVDGVLIKDDALTVDFLHPASLAKSQDVPSLYVPVKTDGEASEDGVKTYFDYSNLADVKMGYYSSGTITALSGLNAPSSDDEVTTYYEGGTRASGVIGASSATSAKFYTVTLAKGFENGEVVGATVYGDTYEENTEVTVQGKANDGYVLEYWVYFNKDAKQNINSAKISTTNPYTFEVTEDVTLIPIFSAEAAAETPEPGTPAATEPASQNLPLWTILVIVGLSAATLGLVVVVIKILAKKTAKKKKAPTKKPAAKTKEIKK